MMNPNSPLLRVIGASAMLWALGCKATSPTDATRYVGESFGGGVVFYVDDSGQHGLIAAASDLSNATWGSFTVTNATATALGSGKSNTTMIAAVHGVSSYAANICDQLVLNGYSDWFLPSKDELSYLYNQKTSVSGLGTGYYWTSSEASATSAWAQRFATGSQETAGKAAVFTIRPIRSF